jgi:hypothetical protein
MISYKMSQLEQQQQHLSQQPTEVAQQWTQQHQGHQQNEEAQQQTPQQHQSHQQNEETQQQTQQEQGQQTHEEEASAGSQSESASHQRKTRSRTSWPTDVMSVGEVNDEGLPLDMIVNTRLSRVCGLAAWQRVPLTLQGFDELTKNEKDELFKNSIQAYVQYTEELM